MPNVNALIFIHGIVEDTIPASHAPQYDALLTALQQKQPVLRDRIDTVIRVEWGHAPLQAGGTLLPDEELTDAENTILAATSYDRIKAHPTADDSFLHLPLDFLQ